MENILKNTVSEPKIGACAIVAYQTLNLVKNAREVPNS